MEKLILTTAILGFALFSTPSAFARDTKLILPIKGALETAKSDEKLDGSVKFFFGDQRHPPVIRRLSQDKTSKKTNAVGKTDEEACNHVFLSALLALDQRAKQLEANAVVNIKSNYGNQEFSSATDFECHAGAIMAGVALKGDFVKIADK